MYDPEEEKRERERDKDIEEYTKAAEKLAAPIALVCALLTWIGCGNRKMPDRIIYIFLAAAGGSFATFICSFIGSLFEGLNRRDGRYAGRVVFWVIIGILVVLEALQ